MAIDPRSQLDEMISQIENGVGLSHRSRGKYAELRAWLSELAGLQPQELGFAYVPDYQGYTRASAQVSQTPIGVMLVAGDEDKVVASAQGLVRPPVEGLFVVVKEGGHWTVLRTIRNGRTEPVERLIDALGVSDERVTEPSARQERAGVPEEKPPRFSRNDCELLARYAASTRWKALPTEESDAVLDLQARLRLLATLAGRAAGEGDPELSPFVSRYVVRGGNMAKDMWCCLYPASVGNKSYGLQVAFIVMADRAELCFCLGRASAQERNEESRLQHRRELERAKTQLSTLPPAAAAALDQLVATGFQLRDEWRKPPAGSDYANGAEWLADAAAPDTGGMSVSRYYSPEDLDERGEAITDDMTNLVTRVLPIFDHVYGGSAPHDAALELTALIDRCKKELGYPRQHDRGQIAAREEVLGVLTQESLDAAITAPDTFDLASFRRIASNAYGGAGNQGQLNSYLSTGVAAIPPLARTIRHLLYDPEDELDRLDDVLEDPAWKVRGFGEALATKCLAIVYPERWLPLFVYRGENGKRAVMRLADLPVEPLNEQGKSRAQLAKESNDVLLDLLRPYYGDDSWGAMVFLWWVLKQKEDDEDLIPAEADLGALADELLLPVDWLQRVLELLEDKKQLIFFGPPGTGKTYVARRLARFIAPDDQHRKTIQFHPSYAYEDFIEGFRPRESDDGAVRYELTPGPLRRLAKIAEESAEPCVLLIDEINRGNIAKVFGELYYLLEYRGDDDQIDLQYGSEPFELAENLLIVGTMNTADRSIAILDAALRRRFHFVEFFPDRWPVEGLLRRWLQRNAPTMVYVADLVDATNRLLDRHLQIGPSYFMRPNLDRRWLERIWAHSVLPYIEDQFYDEPDRVEEFTLAAVEERMNRATPDAPATIEEVDHPAETDPTPGVATD